MRPKLGSTLIFIDRCALIFREPFIQSFYIILYNQQYKQTKKKRQMAWKKNWFPSRSTEQSKVNQNSWEYWVFCILQTLVKQEK